MAVGEVHQHYTRRSNFREKWRGYLWQGRFASFVMDEPYLLATARYVELNPVRANLVEHPGDWPWSSARAHLAGRDDGLVKAAPLLAKVSRDVSARLFWGSPSFGLPSYRNMLKQTPEGKDRTFVEFPLRAASEAQEIKVRLADTPSWRDTITVLQLLVGVEPGKSEGIDVAIESMRFVKQ